ncbi:MAG: alpha-glucosidase [Bacteroidota bacterium]
MKRTWWKEGVIYQIYPRSFNDSDGDGVGDLKGILEKVPYLASLGIDIIWLSPVYQSPNDDNGYDISDYYNIMTEFGNMADFDQLLEAIHAHGMRLLMDLVVNHSSDEHEWFVQSRQSKDNPYRDFYHWRATPNGSPPNNWRSFFSGSAWEYDEPSGEYYLHLFTKKQPDLNWENPKLRQAVYDMMHFWLQKGVDGFRMDVIPLISKDLAFADKDWSKLESNFGTAYANGPRVHEFLKEMNQEVMAKYDIMTVGEAPGVSTEQAGLYVNEDRDELNMIFHFGHMFMDHGPGGRMDPIPIRLQDFTSVFEEWDAAVGKTGWNSLYLGNHDFPRMVSRFGNEAYRVESAKLLATLLFTLRGTPGIYMGDEIGMTNTPFQRIEDYRDVEALNAWEEWKREGKDLDQFLEAGRSQARDHARTPMLWDNSQNAGFTHGTPWIMVNPNYTEVNVAAAEADPNSVLHYYRQLIKLRKAHLPLVYGEMKVLDTGNENIYAYEREFEGKTYQIFLNFSNQAQSINQDLPSKDLLISNYADHHSANLRPWEAIVFG